MACLTSLSSVFTQFVIYCNILLNKIIAPNSFLFQPKGAFFLFSLKTYVVGTYKKCLSVALLMNTTTYVLGRSKKNNYFTDYSSYIEL